MKKVVIILVSWSLCFYPQSIFSQGQRERGGEWYDTAVGVINNVSSSIMGTQNPNSSMPHMPQSAASLGVATTAERLQAKIVPHEVLPLPFQGCLVAQKLSAFPPQKCESEIFLGPQAQDQYQQYNFNKANADENVNFLKDMLDQTKSETATGAVSGIKCLEDRVTLEETKFQNLLNLLTSQADLIKRKNEIFKEQLKNTERQMEDIHSLLNGTGQGEENNNKKERSLSGLINSKQCQDLLTETAIAGATRQGGLLKLRSNITTQNDNASEYRNREQQLEDETRKQISQIAGHIGTYGVDAWLSISSNDSTSTFKRQKIGNFQAVKQDAIERFRLEKASLQGELKKAGLSSIPNMGKNFSNNFGRYRANYRSTFKKQYIEGCVFNTNSSKGPGNINMLISNLYQPGTKRKGTVNSFKSELQGIFDSTGYIEDKVEKVQALVQRYGENTVVADFMRNGQRTSTNIANILSNAINVCQKQYERVDINALFSPRQQLDTVSTLLEEYQDLGTDLSTEITSSLREKILNCDGQTVTTDSCRQGNPFSPEEDSFCFSKAKKCSSDIASCHSSLDTLVNQQTHELNRIADTENLKRKDFVGHQNAILTDLKTKIGTYAEMINATVPGANFSFPEDMFIKTPETAQNRFGVFLVGGDNIESLFEELPQKINTLKDSLSEQNEKMRAQLGDRINDIRQGLQESLAEWQEVSSSCGQKLQNFQTKMGEHQAQQAQQEGEMMQKTKAFCRKYNDLQGFNLGAGCDDVEDLYSDSMEIAFLINPDIINDVREYRKLCAEFQNESESALENEDRNAGDLFRDCLNDPDSTSHDRRNEVNESVANRLPSYDKQTAQEKIDGLLEIDFDKINQIARRYINSCNTPAEEYQQFCTTFNDKVKPILNGGNISPSNYNTIKRDLAVLQRMVKREDISTPPESGDFPLPTEQEEELKSMAEDKLRAVLQSEGNNFCNAIATKAVVSIFNHCQNDGHTRNCFNTKLEEYEEEGTPRIRNIARHLDTISRGTILGEAESSDISCSAFDNGERFQEDLYLGREQSEPQTIDEAIYGR